MFSKKEIGIITVATIVLFALVSLDNWTFIKGLYVSFTAVEPAAVPDSNRVKAAKPASQPAKEGNQPVQKKKFNTTDFASLEILISRNGGYLVLVGLSDKGERREVLVSTPVVSGGDKKFNGDYVVQAKEARRVSQEVRGAVMLDCFVMKPVRDGRPGVFIHEGSQGDVFSHGCNRLQAWIANVLYQIVPVGTRVLIRDSFAGVEIGGAVLPEKFSDRTITMNISRHGGTNIAIEELLRGVNADAGGNLADEHAQFQTNIAILALAAGKIGGPKGTALYGAPSEVQQYVAANDKLGLRVLIDGKGNRSYWFDGGDYYLRFDHQQIEEGLAKLNVHPIQSVPSKKK